jgi:ATP-binding protein involved in chromosome partitioning
MLSYTRNSSGYVDPRLFIIPEKLSRFKHVVAVLSPKGGVGKTTIATLLAIALGKWCRSTVLLDLDIENPTAHIVLGLDIDNVRIEEDRGVLPIKISEKNLEFMSVAIFTRGKLLPIRGKDVVNVVRELLSVTRWRSDVMVVDTPPGFSDVILEFSKLVEKVKYVIVSTPDPLSISSTRRVVEYLRSENVSVIGIVGNMCRNEDDDIRIQELGKSLGVEVITCIPWIDNMHRYYGNLDELLNIFHGNIVSIINKVVGW